MQEEVKNKKAVMRRGEKKAKTNIMEELFEVDPDQLIVEGAWAVIRKFHTCRNVCSTIHNQ